MKNLNNKFSQKNYKNNVKKESKNSSNKTKRESIKELFNIQE